MCVFLLLIDNKNNDHRNPVEKPWFFTIRLQTDCGLISPANGHFKKKKNRLNICLFVVLITNCLKLGRSSGRRREFFKLLKFK